MTAKKLLSTLWQDTVTMGSGVAQLTERSLPIPEDRVSNPVVGNFYYEHIKCELLKRRKEKKRPRMAQFLRYFLLKGSYQPIW